MFVFVGLLLLPFVLCESECYWKGLCVYDHYGTKTPYNAVRGDIRDHKTPENCKAASIYSLHRYGNKYPDKMEVDEMKRLLHNNVKEKIVQKWMQKRTEDICAQDTEDLSNWNWNNTIETCPDCLTEFGKDELFNIGKRIRLRYPELFDGKNEYYVRSVDNERSSASVNAFIDGISRNKKLFVTIDKSSYHLLDTQKPCDLYHSAVKNNVEIYKITSMDNSVLLNETIHDVKERNALENMSRSELLSLYKLCAYDRSWTATMKSPWCPVFHIRELVSIEKNYDILHYYRNAYGSQVNVKLGDVILRDVYEHFAASVEGQRKPLVSHFTRSHILAQAIAAMGLYNETPTDDLALNKKWTTSVLFPYAANIIFVLNRCKKTIGYKYMVELYHNENRISLCETDICTWEDFVIRFKRFENSNMDICKHVNNSHGNSVVQQYWLILIMLTSILLLNI